MARSWMAIADPFRDVQVPIGSFQKQTSLVGCGSGRLGCSPFERFLLLLCQWPRTITASGHHRGIGPMERRPSSASNTSANLRYQDVASLKAIEKR